MSAFALVLLIAPLAIDFYDEPRLQELFTWMALIFLVTPFGQQFQMLMQRELQFDTLARIEIGAVVAGTIGGIAGSSGWFRGVVSGVGDAYHCHRQGVLADGRRLADVAASLSLPLR
ncbi:oligosaccharide flippase family protein [bacterium]|nr:oligosaccharide flippase family protein [bacterium]